ncbi:MAG: nucleotidyltransferase domain-containing protein [Deltaproteobacteria bacterium]|nr:nucleotidyltransferase domain-containing protein [Deltaproteobacteria bacterium]MBI3390656.1 nucleotidyltransferase domain-containing protein [Deltaproteobacteria bacterium]
MGVNQPNASRHVRPRGTVSEGILQEIVRRIVEAVRPEKIILFGSAARGEMGPDSDVDLLVVKAGVDRRAVAQLLYRRLAGVGVAKNILVVTPGDVERHKDNIGLVISPALREGRVIYAA